MNKQSYNTTYLFIFINIYYRNIYSWLQMVIIGLLISSESLKNRFYICRCQYVIMHKWDFFNYIMNSKFDQDNGLICELVLYIYNSHNLNLHKNNLSFILDEIKLDIHPTVKTNTILFYLVEINVLLVQRHSAYSWCS